MDPRSCGTGIHLIRKMPLQYTVIIPTLNAAGCIRLLIESLLQQRQPPEEIVIVDSQSSDGTPDIAASLPLVRVISVNRNEFDHGGTRDEALRDTGTPIVVFLTQDALPMDADWAGALLAPFEDGRVAAVCGRQVARPDSRAYEKAIRAYRYADQNVKWDRADLQRLSVRAFLLSDACAAYRREAYEAVGGFEHPIITNEDMLIAADLLNAGYRLAYAADAKVWHSHDHTLRQEYARNRKIGWFMEQYEDRFMGVGELNEGFRLASHISKELARQGKPGELLCFWLNCAMRLLGNRVGRYRSRQNSRRQQR